MPKKTLSTTETGEDYVTPVVGFIACKWCNTAVATHVKGRLPEYCGPNCRNAMARAKKRLADAQRALRVRGTMDADPDPDQMRLDDY